MSYIFLQFLLVVSDNSLYYISLWTSFLSLVSSRWDNDKVCLLDKAGSSLCTDVPPPSEKKKTGKDYRFFLREGGRLYTG